MKWAGHVVRKIELINAYILVRKREGWRQHGKLRRK
jgi:hypothetical protein